MVKKYAIYIFFNFLFSTTLLNAQYISRPEIVGYNGGGHNFCQTMTLRLKFDAENFNPGNVFTVQLSQPNGSFATTTLMQGSLAATNGQNQFIDVRFPNNVQPGNSYRLRIVGSNPFFIGNEPNEFPFAVSTLPNYDPDAYGVDEWRAYVYTWTTNIPPPLTAAQANTINFFQNENRAGYFTQTCFNIEYNWSNNQMPGNLVPPNRNFVCGRYGDFFSVRFKRRFNFEPGNYDFIIGGDDGVRFSVDGGNTWLLNDWSEHSYRTLATPTGGVFLSGERELVLEFFERNVFARVTLRGSKVGSGEPVDPPVVFPPSLTNLTVCSGAAPFQLNGVTPSGGQFSGNGVTPGGLFNPGAFTTLPASTTITYTVGEGNCVRSGSVTINIVEGAVAQINMPSQVCQNAGLINLSASIPGGIFSGNGVSGNTFNPLVAGVGRHAINYQIPGSGGNCPVDVTDTIRVNAVPVANITNTNLALCTYSPPVTLEATPAGGTFFGAPGITGNTFNPAGLAPGNYTVQYRVTIDGCSDTTEKTFTINPKPDASFTGLPQSLCSNASAVTLTPTVTGGTFSGTGVSGNQFIPANAGLGNVAIKYVITVNGCTDSTTQTVNVLDGTPLPTPSISNLPGSYCNTDAAIILSASPAGGTFSGPGVSGNQFIPSQAGIGPNTITYRITSNSTCVEDAIASVVFTVIETPVADAGNTLIVEEGKSGTLNGSSSVANSVFLWTPSSGLSNPNIPNPTVTPIENTLYTLTVSDITNTCSTSDTVSVKVVSKLFIPNLITNNGDSRNDTWDIKGLDAFPDCKIEVYNRWGKRIYSTTGYKTPWKPDKVSPGTYYYTLSRFEGDMHKGTVQIVD